MQEQALGHIGKGRFKAQVLRLQIRFPGSELLSVFLYDSFEIAIDRIDLLGHQRHRPIGPPPGAIEVVVGTADKIDEPIDVDLAGGVGRLGESAG